MVMVVNGTPPKSIGVVVALDCCSGGLVEPPGQGPKVEVGARRDRCRGRWVRESDDLLHIGSVPRRFSQYVYIHICIIYIYIYISA